MSSTKTFLILSLLILLGSMGAAQAQIARIELLAQPEPAAREGGKNEAAGDVWLDIELQGQLTAAVTSFTLTYSSPLAAGLMVVATNGIEIEGGRAMNVVRRRPESRRRNDQDHT